MRPIRVYSADSVQAEFCEHQLHLYLCNAHSGLTPRRQIAGIFIPHWLLKRLPLKRNQELNVATDYIKQVCRDLIVKKRERMEKGQASEVDILSVALSSGGFTDENLV